MAKFHKTKLSHLIFHCPGCNEIHIVDSRWTFNENVNAPTVSPSVLVRYRHPKGHSNENPAPVDYSGEYVEEVCHSFIRDGKIQFLSDCTHELKGKTIEIPNFEELHPGWLD
ncbi:MAG: DUF6527 family protein [Proteiniphilum sp.]